MSILWQQAGGLQGPSVSFLILVAALVVTTLILWRRYQSRRQLVNRIAELEALSAAGRALVASQLDVGALCELIAQEAANIIDTSTFQIGLFEDSTYKILYWSVDGRLQPTPQTFDLSEEGGLVGWVFENRRSLLVKDFQKDMVKLPARPRYISENPPRSAVFVPLLSGSDVSGLLAAQSLRPDAFSQRDLGRLTILANQATAAITNAQIYEQERKRAAHLELVGNIARQVSAINDIDELLRRFVDLTQQTFDFGSVNVFQIDPVNGDAVIQASTIADLEPASLRLRPGQGLVGTAVVSAKTTLSNYSLEDPRFFSDEFSAATRSEIAIPLIVDQKLMGVLDVQSPQVGIFTSQEQAVLEALAAQVAVALHKAQQLAYQREQRWVATAQLQVVEAISQSPDLDSLMKTLVRLTALLVGAERCAILLWDDEIESYTISASFGYAVQVTDRLGKAAIPIGEWNALDAVHIGGESLTTGQLPPWTTADPDSSPGSEGKNTLLLPLVSKGRVLAVMVVGFARDIVEPLSGSLGELLRNIASLAAQAIDNLQLQLAQQEEAWVNTALLQVAEAVNMLTDLNEILYTIVRMIPILVGVRSCVILFRDDELGAYRAGPSHGLTEMGKGLLESFEVNLSEFPLLGTQDVERLGPDAAYYTFRLPDWMHLIMDSETANIFPLNARGRLVGALVVGPTLNDRPLTGRRLNIVTGITQQAAIAVVNNQLYKESAERSRMEQELDVARSIQASLIPHGAPDIPGCTVASYWRAARQVSGDFYDFMPLADGRWGIAIADVADKGIPAALFMALSRTILRTVAFNRHEPAEVLKRSNLLIFGDTSSDLFVTIFYAVWDAKKQTLTYASGGHNPPVLVKSSGRITLLNSEGIALGVLDQINIAQHEIRLRSGDIVVFYTDGVTEAMNEDFDEFGMERLCAIIQSARQGEASDIMRAITTAVEDHAGGTPQSDDITLVVMKR